MASSERRAAPDPRAPPRLPSDPQAPSSLALLSTKAQTGGRLLGLRNLQPTIPRYQRPWQAPDILARDTLDAWSAAYPGRLNVTHVLSHEPAGSAWAGARGFISEPLLRQALTPPDADSALFVCGPPPMYDLLCGPRGEEELTGLLADMGYTAGQVHKF